MTARDQPPVLGYDDTPRQPDGRWRIHDSRRPQPPIVTPGPAPTTPSPAPSDAIVLLGAHDDLSAWQMMDGSKPTWRMANGVLQTGKGFLRTTAEFTDMQLHVEFATPSEVKGDSQGRGNSEWQTYDIVFTAPRFTAAGALDHPAVATVLHNGVLVHEATPFWGPTQHRRIDPYTTAAAKGPLALQDHGNPIRYRNIWLRKLTGAM